MNLKKITIMIIIVLLCSMRTLAIGPGEGRNHNIAVVGDSYAGHFSLNEGFDDYEYFIFPVGTIGSELNRKVFEDAINSKNTYIVFASGVNDQALSTDLVFFETVLREYIAKINQYRKYLFFHTYMDYANRKNSIGRFLPEDYDKIYRKLADEFDNVIYIDMTSFNNKKHDIGDGLHYDRFFYDSFKAKLTFLIDSIESTVFGNHLSKNAGISKNIIAVAGDVEAYNFYLLEKDKRHILLNFAGQDTDFAQQNDNIYRAIDSEAKSVIISTGSKEYEEQISIEMFKDALRGYLNYACLKHKNVFLYGSFNYDNQKELPIIESIYDMAIEQVAAEYPNTCYVDLRNYKKDTAAIYDIMYGLIGEMVDNIF